MKEIIDFIKEGFKINSKTVTKQEDEVEFNLNKGHKFPTEKEIDIIKDLTYKLPLLPDKVFLSYSRIIFRYNRAPKKQLEKGWHINNSISIYCHFQNGKKILSVSFLSVEQKGPILYNEHPKNITDCFKAINELWKEIDFSKIVEKYK